MNTNGLREIVICTILIIAVPAVVWWWIEVLKNFDYEKEKCPLIAQMPTDEYTGVAARGTRKRLYVNVYECPDGKVKRLIERGPVNYK